MAKNQEIKLNEAPEIWEGIQTDMVTLIKTNYHLKKSIREDEEKSKKSSKETTVKLSRST